MHSPWNVLWDRSPGAVWTWGKLRIPIPLWNWKSQKGTWPEKPRKKTQKTNSRAFHSRSHKHPSTPNPANLKAKDSPRSHPSRFFLASPLPFSQNPNPKPSGVALPDFQRGLQLDPHSRSCQQGFLGAAGQAWIGSQGSSLVSKLLLEDFPAFPADFCPVDSPGPAQDVQLGGNPARGGFGMRESQIPEWDSKK